MSTAPLEDPGDDGATHGLVRFTRGGEVALDALAGRLAAEAGDTPASIAEVLDRILSSDVADLAAELTPTADTAAPAQVDATEMPAAETPDDAARRRLGDRRARPEEGPRGPGFGVDR